MKPARDNNARDFSRAQGTKALLPQFRGQALEIGMLGSSENLHPFLSEISIEAGEREPRTINGRFANLSMKPDAWAFQLHLQLPGVRLVKTLHRDHGHGFSSIAR